MKVMPPSHLLEYAFFKTSINFKLKNVLFLQFQRAVQNDTNYDGGK